MKITVRKDVFETNSSSTHCLCISKDSLNESLNEDIFLQKYDLLGGQEENLEDHTLDGVCFKSVQNKLTYFIKILLMSGKYGQYADDEEEAEMGVLQRKLLNLLIEIFPNTDFSQFSNLPDDYYYEDGDCWFYAWDDPELTPFLDKDILKKLFQFGIIYFGNRDDEDFSNFVWLLTDNKEYLSAEVSG